MRKGTGGSRISLLFHSLAAWPLVLLGLTFFISKTGTIISSYLKGRHGSSEKAERSVFFVQMFQAILINNRNL
jgi:hypothetical protein